MTLLTSHLIVVKPPTLWRLHLTMVKTPTLWRSHLTMVIFCHDLTWGAEVTINLCLSIWSLHIVPTNIPFLSMYLHINNLFSSNKKIGKSLKNYYYFIINLNDFPFFEKFTKFLYHIIGKFKKTFDIKYKPTFGSYILTYYFLLKLEWVDRYPPLACKINN